MSEYEQRYKQICDKLGITVEQADKATYGVCSYCSAFNHDYGTCLSDVCSLIDNNDYVEIEKGTGIYGCN